MRGGRELSWGEEIGVQRVLKGFVFLGHLATDLDHYRGVLAGFYIK